MKTLIILAMGIWAGSMSCLAQTSQDTTIVVNNAKKITIEKSRNSMAVKVEGTADNPDYFYSQTMEVDSSAAVIATEKNADWDFTIPFVNKNKKSRRYRRNFPVTINLLKTSRAQPEATAVLTEQRDASVGPVKGKKSRRIPGWGMLALEGQ